MSVLSIEARCILILLISLLILPLNSYEIPPLLLSWQTQIKPGFNLKTQKPPVCIANAKIITSPILIAITTCGQFTPNLSHVVSVAMAK